MYRIKEFSSWQESLSNYIYLNSVYICYSFTSRRVIESRKVMADKHLTIVKYLLPTTLDTTLEIQRSIHRYYK